MEALCKARLAALKALPRRGGAWNAASYYQALARPIELKARVVNLSLGGGIDPGEQDIILDLQDAGIVVLAAMGNEFEEGNPTSYPAGRLLAGERRWPRRTWPRRPPCCWRRTRT